MPSPQDLYPLTSFDANTHSGDPTVFYASAPQPKGYPLFPPHKANTVMMFLSAIFPPFNTPAQNVSEMQNLIKFFNANRIYINGEGVANAWISTQAGIFLVWASIGTFNDWASIDTSPFNPAYLADLPQSALPIGLQQVLPLHPIPPLRPDPTDGSYYSNNVFDNTKWWNFTSINGENQGIPSNYNGAPDPSATVTEEPGVYTWNGGNPGGNIYVYAGFDADNNGINSQLQQFGNVNFP